MASPIADRISNDLKVAMKARETARIDALRLLRAAMIELAKSGKEDFTDEDALAVLRRLSKQRDEAAAAYDAAGRSESADNERAEMRIIETYLPKLADEDTTMAWVKEAIAQSGATSKKELGKVMGVLNKAHKGQMDMSLARAVIERELGD